MATGVVAAPAAVSGCGRARRLAGRVSSASCAIRGRRVSVGPGAIRAKGAT
jgi:hypothetical protein